MSELKHRKDRSTGFLRAGLLGMFFLVALLPVKTVLAHVSEQGFMLLLPTDIYIRFGVAAVALTVLALALLPATGTLRLFGHKTVRLTTWPGVATTSSLVSTALLAALVLVGFLGPRDPLANLLPLMIWTIWWVAFVVLQGLLGDLWHWFNPWSGLYRLLRDGFALSPKLTLPAWLGIWPGVFAFLAFMAFALADLAPDDPDRLAGFVAGYWLYTLAGMILFGGDTWLERGECFSILLRHYASLSVLQRDDRGLQPGTPGWRLIKAPALSFSGAVFILVLLGSGTFDGINETFWWLAQIGINPLAFPGRSAVVWPTLVGLVLSNLALIAIFAATLYAGLRLAGESLRFAEAFGRMVRAILPIALGYHAAHYLTVLLVSGQYALAALNDPWTRGANFLGLGDFRVTTGFFNTQATVEVIWLTQAGAIVVGHMLAVMISHGIAVDMFGDNKKATLSQIPMAVFMILYTLMGLTLLAAPRGA
jgi:hypothetical protein